MQLIEESLTDFLSRDDRIKFQRLIDSACSDRFMCVLVTVELPALGRAFDCRVASYSLVGKSVSLCFFLQGEVRVSKIQEQPARSSFMDISGEEHQELASWHSSQQTCVSSIADYVAREAHQVSLLEGHMPQLEDGFTELARVEMHQTARRALDDIEVGDSRRARSKAAARHIDQMSQISTRPLQIAVLRGGGQRLIQQVALWRHDRDSRHHMEDEKSKNKIK